jgi:putative acetyltransferase
MITIRQARVEDAPTLCAAEQETARTPGLLASQPGELQPESFASLIAALSDGSGCYVVAEEKSHIVGHAFLRPMDLRATSHVFVLTIVVHPGHTARGIGTAIMNAVADWARRTPQVQKVELCVRSTNAQARQLYEKFGFVEEGCFRKRICLPDGKLIDDIAMAWFPKQAAA